MAGSRRRTVLVPLGPGPPKFFSANQRCPAGSRLITSMAVVDYVYQFSANFRTIAASCSAGSGPVQPQLNPRRHLRLQLPERVPLPTYAAPLEVQMNSRAQSGCLKVRLVVPVACDTHRRRGNEGFAAGVDRAHRLRRGNAGGLLAQGMGVPMTAHRARICCMQFSACAGVIGRPNGGRSRVAQMAFTPSVAAPKPPSTSGVDPGMF